MDYDIYLQGSYKNDTNIRGDSDVDLVVELKSSFIYDISTLSPVDQVLFNQDIRPAIYDWFQFRAHVLRALQSYYGSASVREGNKSLKIDAGSGRLSSDIIVCQQYRKYSRYRNIYDLSFIEGIIFFVSSENRWAVNYPKLHYENGVRKNSQSFTNGWFKHVVRIFKNARTYLEENSAIPDDLAPSYFLECLIYNAPNDKFGHNYQCSFHSLLSWLNGLGDNDMNQLLCQNGLIGLFGNSPEQWSTMKAQRLISSLTGLWNNWH